MYVIDLPIFTMASKKKRFYLNLNVYRNAHFRVLDKAKKDYETICRDLLKGIPPLDHVHLVYTFFAPSKQRSDTANVCCIVDKFFSDALVKCGILTDDNRDVVLSVLFRFGGVDPTNPRVEATLASTEELSSMSQGSPIENPLDLTKEDPTRPTMKITIVETEIQAAIRAYIQEQIQVRDGHVIDMEIRATRGEEGFIANIDIHPEGTPSAFATDGKAPLGIVRTVEAARAAPAPAPAAAAPKAAATTAKPKVTAPAAAAPAPEPERQPDVKEPEQAQEPVVEEEPPFSPEAGIDERERVEEPQGAAEPPEVPDQDRDLGVDGGQPLNKKPSIFANLPRPTNPKPEATDA